MHLMHALASGALEDLGGPLGHNSLDLGGTLDKQESPKPERVDGQPLARHDEDVRVVSSREDIHVPQRE